MITMQGKYNSANIFIDDVDTETKNQIQGFLNNPTFKNSYIAIMPDCHKGNGSCIGFTMKLNDYIIPNIVGVDIGCGMLSCKFDIKNIDLEKFDNFIKKNIPSGFNINKEIPDSVYEDESIDYDVQEIASNIKIDYVKALKAIGSLGGGNHFIEIGKDSKNYYWITIHSGSRNFGLRVSNYYQSIAKENLKKYFIENEYKDLEFLLTKEKDGQDYIRDMKIAQYFASLNRYEMMNRIERYLGLNNCEKIESVHNFIDEVGMIRKGATPALENQKVIIPFNMRDGLAICTGKGNKKWNYSAPHGAGRILSRTKAKQLLSVNEFIEDMSNNNIYTSTANASTIDESPNAYKDFNTILECVKETVEVNELIKPIYNFKAGGE